MSSLLRFLSSLKLAVIVILALAGSLIAGTIFESLYDMKTAWYYVYRAWWFHAILAALGVNIIAVAISRWPWKKKHLSFLLAHAGIVLLIVGAWVTQQYGLDGMMTVREGETQAQVELDDTVLMARKKTNAQFANIPWMPPDTKFKPITVQPFGVQVSDYLSHADAQYEFSEDIGKNGEVNPAAAPALLIKLKGGPLQVSQEYWLFGGSAEWSILPLGPARFQLIPRSHGGDEATILNREISFEAGELAHMDFFETKEGGLGYRSMSASGKKKSEKFAASEVEGKVIEPGWMGMKITVKKWIRHAKNTSYYTPARIQYGDQAPPSAIAVQVGEEKFWLGEGQQASTAFKDNEGAGELELFYFRRKKVLPFGLKLNRFQIDHYQGSQNPMSYSSLVSVVDGQNPRTEGEIQISMNEPLEHRGFTIYQSSYVPDNPRPTVSIFSVNQDPGRMMKYVGSILLVLGVILLFAIKYLRTPWLVSLFK